MVSQFERHDGSFPSYATPSAVRPMSSSLMAANGKTMPPRPYTARLRLSRLWDVASRYFTPLRANGMSATMMSALYMTAAKMAVVGLVRRMMLSASSAGYNGTNNAGMMAKYFAIIPALFVPLYPALEALNIMRLTSPTTAILAAVIYNALIIVALIPLALKGVKYREATSQSLLKRNLAVYGLGGIVLPFAAIKLLDMGLTALGVA